MSEPDDQSEIDHVPSPEEILAAEQEANEQAAGAAAMADTERQEEATQAAADQAAPVPPAEHTRRAFVCETSMAWLSPGARDATYIAAGTEGSWTQMEIDSLLAQGAKLRPVLPTKAEKLASLQAQMAAVEAEDPDPDQPVLPGEPVVPEAVKTEARAAKRKPRAAKAK